MYIVNLKKIERRMRNRGNYNDPPYTMTSKDGVVVPAKVKQTPKVNRSEPLSIDRMREAMQSARIKQAIGAVIGGMVRRSQSRGS